MRSIQPVNIWVQGTQKSANNLDMKITYDNLSTKAIFKYYLISSTTYPDQHIDSEGQVVETTSYLNEILLENQLEISGQDYQNWGSTGDPNNEAYVWACQQLNLVLN